MYGSVHAGWLTWVAEVMDDIKIAPTMAYMTSFECILKCPDCKKLGEIDERMKTEALPLLIDL